MNINSISFKGYDACPIKSLYMQGIINKKHFNIFNELKEVCKKEGIDLFVHNNPGVSTEFNGVYNEDQSPWAQDSKCFVRIGSKTKIVTEHPDSLDDDKTLKDFVRSLGYKYKKSVGFDFLHGGNAYIGKKPNGEKWILMGEYETLDRYFDKVRKSYRPENICTNYGVKKENIYTISQPNFHIDMAIRPIGYPYILVNDEKMAIENASEQGDEFKSKTAKYYQEFFSAYNPLLKKYDKSDKIVRELEQQGFKPIRIAGIYGPGINYMNAIVNKHPDGTISYITNSTRNSEFEGLDEVFERELRAKVPNIRDVYFISGEQDNEYPNLNEVMEILINHKGGVHCLNLEEPDFEAWG